MDLIDRDALEPFYESGTDPTDTYADMAFIRAEHIENAPAVNRWIPCSERLPETDVDVLAYYPYWYDNMFQNSGIVVAKLCYDRLTCDICGEFNPGLSAITHWMPLPERPEKE